MDGITESGVTIKRGPGRPKNPDPIEDLKEFMSVAAYRLELAAAMRAGVMDSEAKHLEVQNTIRDIILSVAEDLRSKC